MALRPSAVAIEGPPVQIWGNSGRLLLSSPSSAAGFRALEESRFLLGVGTRPPLAWFPWNLCNIRSYIPLPRPAAPAAGRGCDQAWWPHGVQESRDPLP